MARARNIKPAIMDNEKLADMKPLHRLLFIYLWMLADREGRLEDIPSRIAKQALGYDRSANVNAMLDDLAREGFITRYTAAGIKCIKINSFLKHQTPHGTEKDSDLPDENGLHTVHTRGKNGYATGELELVNRSLTVKQLSDNTLIPDSGLPDSGLPDCSLPGSEVEAVASKPKKTKPRSAFPEDFSPNDAGIAAAVGLSLSAELAAFRNHHLAQGSLMADWQAAFRTWCGKAHKFAKPAAEPAWRTEQRERTQIAAPGVAAQPATDFFMEQTNGTSNRLGGPDIRQADGDLRAGLPAPLGRH